MNQHDDLTPKMRSIAGPPAGASLLVLTDHALSGWQQENLRGKLIRSGISPSTCPVVSLDGNFDCRGKTIVGLGEKVLRALTDKRGIDKWVLSPLHTISGELFIPTYDFARTNGQYELNLYQELALRRAAEMSASPPHNTPENFRLNPSLEETYAILTMLESAEEVAVDVETGYGQINTVGFAWSPSDAIAINVLPDRCADHNFFELWTRIRRVLESPSRKIFQNFIYDTSYFSAYGIRTEGEIFDTMWAMKFLWPEFKSNLGNVGRFYTKRVYWKDDGKVTEEEGQKKDWGNVRDWTKHYNYNCRDTSGTLEASRNQREDISARGLTETWNYVKRLVEPIREMCATGMPVDLSVKEKLQTEIESKIKELTEDFKTKVGDINPKSPKQVMTWLKESGVSMPKKFDKLKGGYKESTDAASLKKIRLKHPSIAGLVELQQIKTLSKALSSYVAFEIRPDGRLPYSLNGCGTETLRFSGNKDPWDRGFNIQTIPREGGAVSVKSMFVAPDGFTFIEADLKAAETYYVAYASVCKKMMDMLHSGADIHKHVAYAILRALGKSEADYEKKWRDLGKKTGHGSNYLMKEGTFVENVFKDMSMILSKKEGKAMLEAYFQEFPEIRQWHNWVRGELYTKRKLTAPSGWERYFYGRPGDDMLREAVAWAPQHTVPWITNHMMFYLMEERKKGNLKFHLLVQVHDALYLLCPDDWVEKVGRACLRTAEWAPEVILPGGKLVIPVEVETAKCLAHKESFK
jgi:DNA polymerase I-like protein with 3'-5' exonuclease and polymerase domains